jgi:PIN domain nuclease of toxin-antitoxin system
VIEDGSNEILVSAASAWEIAAKVRLGKLPTGETLAGEFERYLAAWDSTSLPISLAQAVRAGALLGEHRDPFDRMLISQAQIENLPIISNDRKQRSHLRRLPRETDLVVSGG